MKPSRSPLEIVALDNPEVIAVLLDSRQRQALLPFMAQATTIIQAAKATNELPNTMLYRVKRWQELGLLLECGTTPHAKGLSRLYRTSANAFFVAHHATNSIDLLALAKELFAPVLTEFLQAFVQSGERLSDQWGVRFERTANQWQVQPAKAINDTCQPTDATSPATIFTMQEIGLSAAQAKAMQLELVGVIQKYANQSHSKQQTYKVLLGIA